MTDCTPVKRCTKCSQEFPATTQHFHIGKAYADGLHTWCKACTAQYHKQHYDPQKSLAQSRRWRSANPDKAKAATKKRREKNPEKFRGAFRNYSRNNKSKRRQSERKWRSDNPEKARRIDRVKKSNYRAHKRNADGSYSTKDVQAQLSRQKGRCYYCHNDAERDGKSYHVEHVIPINRGGSNSPDNLVISCWLCNAEKGTKTPWEWPQGGRLL